jgi:hypothetical protein
MSRPHPARIALAALLALLAGCASLEGGGHLDAHLGSESAAVRACAAWYRALDEAVEAAGVRDAQYAQLPGFPYFRVDRLLASLRGRAAASEPALQAFAERLLELDLESRRHEIENLAPQEFASLPEMRADFARGAALLRTRGCGRLLRGIDLAKPATRAGILESARVPDDYSLASRVLGLYPLSRIVFADGSRRWEAESRAAFGGEHQAPAEAAPERELARIAALYAPSFEVAVTGDYDRFGQLRWTRGSSVPEVDSTASAVYVLRAFTRYRDQILLQLVYTIWFSERPPSVEGDLLAGRLDGLVWRVTLAPDGEPLLYDSIHPCGCYHQFFPTPRARPRPAPDALEEWAFVPQALPRVAEDERPVVRLASRTHYIERVSLVRGGDSVARYVFQEYDALRSLAQPEGGRRSAFGPDGIVAGTERAERLLFWPMGIRSAGAMRQWGRHATAFVGRRHFDDADLIERRFELDLAERAP